MPISENIISMLGTSAGRQQYPNAVKASASNALLPSGGAQSGSPDFARLLELLRRNTAYRGFDIGELLRLLEDIIGGGGGGGGGGGRGGNEEGGGGGCLIGETLIRMSDGSEKPICELKVHDEILGWDPMLGDVAQVVESTWSSCQPCKVVAFDDDSKVEASRTHQWMVPSRGTITTSNLVPGDVVHGENGQNKMVVSIVESGPKIVFWLACTPNHCYYAGGVLHHNAWYDSPKARPPGYTWPPGVSSTPINGSGGGGGGPA